MSDALHLPRFKRKVGKPSEELTLSCDVSSWSDIDDDVADDVIGGFARIFSDIDSDHPTTTKNGSIYPSSTF